MANTSRKGFYPVGTMNGSAWMEHVRSYPVDSSNATAIFLGDVISLEADGNVAPAAASDTVAKIGVCVGVKVSRSVAATEHPGYLPASTAGTIFVCLAFPTVIFEAQEDSVGGANAAEDVGENVDFIAGAGSTTTGLSGHELDSSTVATTAALHFKFLKLVDRPDNAIGTNAKWLVSMVESHWMATVAGI